MSQHPSRFLSSLYLHFSNFRVPFQPSRVVQCGVVLALLYDRKTGTLTESYK